MIPTSMEPSLQEFIQLQRQLVTAFTMYGLNGDTVEDILGQLATLAKVMSQDSKNFVLESPTRLLTTDSLFIARHPWSSSCLEF